MANYDITTANSVLNFRTNEDMSLPVNILIDSAHYFVQWSDGLFAKAQVLAVDTSTWAVTTAAAVFSEGNVTVNDRGAGIKVDTNHFLCVYQGNSNKSEAQVYAVNTSTWVVTTSTGRFQWNGATNGAKMVLAPVDVNHFLVLWADNTPNGTAQVLAVNTTTFAISTAASALQFSTDNDSPHVCLKIDTNHYMAMWVDANSNFGRAQILTVNTTTFAVTTAAARLVFETSGDLAGSNGAGVTGVIIDTNHVFGFWFLTTSHCYAQVFTINTTTWAITTATAKLDFDTQPTNSASAGARNRHADCAKVDDNHFVVFYPGLNNDGYAQDFEVNTSTYAITTIGAKFNYDTQNGNLNSLIRVDTQHFFNVWNGAASGVYGRAQIFAVTISQAYSQSLTETFSLVDVETKMAGKYLLDSFALAEVFLKKPAKYILDSFTLVDTITRTKIAIKSFVDSFTLVDVVTKMGEKALSEVFTLVDTISHVATMFRSLIETISAIDTVTPTKLAVRSFTETFTLVENQVRVSGKVLLETISLNEIFSRIATNFRSLTETISVVDLVTPLTQYVRALTESFTLVDTVKRTTSKALSDVFTMVDTIAKTPGKYILDSFALVDTKALVHTFNKVLTDAFSLVDTITKSTLYSRAFTEVLTLVQRFRGLINGRDISYFKKYLNQAGTYIKKYLDIP